MLISWPRGDRFVLFLSPNVAFITGFYGAVNGIAFSGLMVGLHVVIAQYFEKRRATAFSVFYTLAGLNTFFVPPIIEHSLSEFGVTRSPAHPWCHLPERLPRCDHPS
uniref:Monocarboxylate transporter n=1 Tax=Ixodes ricinus TaxID=34613 RepID=V5H0K8_IXORI